MFFSPPCWFAPSGWNSHERFCFISILHATCFHSVHHRVYRSVMQTLRGFVFLSSQLYNDGAREPSLNDGKLSLSSRSLTSLLLPHRKKNKHTHAPKFMTNNLFALRWPAAACAQPVRLLARHASYLHTRSHRRCILANGVIYGGEWRVCVCACGTSVLPCWGLLERTRRRVTLQGVITSSTIRNTITSVLSRERGKKK